MDFSRFASKKLLVTAGTVAGLIGAHAYAEAAAVAAAYVTAQGVIDHASAKKASSVLGTLEEVVDAVAKELAKDGGPSDGDGHSVVLTGLAESVSPIPAIKELRAILGLGLRESKDIVDGVRAGHAFRLTCTTAEAKALVAAGFVVS